MTAPALKVDDLSSWYGPIRAVSHTSFSVPTGAIVAILGGNGAGKSTTLKSLLGLVPQRTGRISFFGEDISRSDASQLVRRGIALVPEGRRIFTELSVRENLEIGAGPITRGQLKDRLDRVYAIFPRLKERANQVSGTFSGGEQQMLAIGRALMSEPRFLMLDEPSMGLAPLIVNQVFQTIRQINESGTTILLVEQNARKSLQIASYAYVMEVGRIAMHGTAADLQKDERVKAIYLGG